MNKYCYFYSYHFEINAIESYKKSSEKVCRRCPKIKFRNQNLTPIEI